MMNREVIATIPRLNKIDREHYFGSSCNLAADIRFLVNVVNNFHITRLVNVKVLVLVPAK